MKFEIATPLLGFEDVKEVKLEKIDDIFMKMQTLDDKNISFTLVDPFVLREYDFEIPTKIQKLLVSAVSKFQIKKRLNYHDE